ncbi:unnamed protein product [Arctogadus glacialis]
MDTAQRSGNGGEVDKETAKPALIHHLDFMYLGSFRIKYGLTEVNKESRPHQANYTVPTGRCNACHRKLCNYHQRWMQIKMSEHGLGTAWARLVRGSCTARGRRCAHSSIGLTGHNGAHCNEPSGSVFTPVRSSRGLGSSEEERSDGSSTSPCSSNTLTVQAERTPLNTDLLSCPRITLPYMTTQPEPQLSHSELCFVFGCHGLA